MNTPGTTRLKCDPWGAVLIRFAFTWGCAAVYWHFGTEWAPWRQTPNWGQILTALGLAVWGLWHVIAWAGSSLEVNAAEGSATLRRMTGSGAEPQVFMLSAIAAVTLLPRQGFGAGMGPFRTRRITLRLTNGTMVPVGTISGMWGLDDHAQRIATTLGCGVEEPEEGGRPDPNGTV